MKHLLLIFPVAIVVALIIGRNERDSGRDPDVPARPEPPDASKRFAETLASFQNDCREGDARSCQELGIAYDAGGTCLPKNADKATEFSRKAITLYQAYCDHDGTAAACQQVGIAYDAGRVVTRDASKATAAFKKAITIYQEACDGGKADACQELGVTYGDGSLGVPRNGRKANEFYGQAARIYQNACNEQNANACLQLSGAYDMGTGVPKDAVKASAFLDKACKLGHTLSCLLQNTPDRGLNRPPAAPDWWTHCSSDRPLRAGTHCSSDRPLQAGPPSGSVGSPSSRS
jgi:TPR repeat protein